MIENWIDALAEVWGEMDNGKGGQVRSYHLFDRPEFPDSINEFPAAVSYPTGVQCEYGAGNSIDIWQGKTEFHLTASMQKSELPYVLRFFARIRNAAAKHMTLGGQVAYFSLRADDTNIQGPVTLSYGGEDPHWSLVAYWTVKENVSHEVTI